MKWLQWNAFHKGVYKDRYPETWARLQALNIGITGDMTPMTTIDVLLDYIDSAHQRIEQLELERDLM